MKKFQVTVNGKTYEVDVEEIDGSSRIQEPVATMEKKPLDPPKAPPHPGPRPAPNPGPDNDIGSIRIEAPMQGKIVGVKASIDEEVEEGAVIVVLEAMKMENEIVAPKAGTVASLNVTVGQSVNAGDLIASLN